MTLEEYEDRLKDIACFHSHSCRKSGMYFFIIHIIKDIRRLMYSRSRNTVTIVSWPERAPWKKEPFARRAHSLERGTVPGRTA